MVKGGFSDLGFTELCGSPASTSSISNVHGSKVQTMSPIRADVMLVGADVTQTKTTTGFVNSGVADVVRPRADDSEVSADASNVATGIQRRSVWERIDPAIKDGNKKSFASIVGCVPKPELEFFPLEKEGKLRVLIPKEVTKGMAEPFKSVLYGYFLGPRIPFPLVQKAVQTAWGKFGYKDAMMNEHGTFFFRFHNEGGCTQVVESSPLMIKGVPLFVYPWDPSKGLKKPEHTTCPLWIKFHNIPLVAFNREGISRIASAVGVPLRMDACTASTCDKAWGRTNFAKVLVNVWATGDLQREVEVVIPHLLDDGEDVVKVVLEYDWVPTQCSVCKVFGHKVSSCAKAIVVQDKMIPKPNVDRDGFQKQWKPKPNGLNKQVVKGDTSNVNKANEEKDGDTMVGVGMVTRENPKVNKESRPTDGIGGKPIPKSSEHVGPIQDKSDANLQMGDGKNTRQLKEDNPLKNTTGGVDQGKVYQMDNSNKNLSKPLKSILKNPSNRFSALINTVINFDEEPVGKPKSEESKENVLPNQVEKKDGRKGEDGTTLLPKR